MATVTTKTQVGTIDGTPLKRMFWSIISDYDLKTGICELIDNALDVWDGKKSSSPVIEITLDASRQLFSIKDNAGGVKQSDLQWLLAPGGSGNDPKSETIGIFGVGSKRAGIAIGEQIKIQTRYKKEESFEIEINKDWIEEPDWKLAYYKIPDIRPNTTEVFISHLRKPFAEQEVVRIVTHLEETYSWFIQEGCIIKVNGAAITARPFEQWAFPSGHGPQTAKFDLNFGKNDKLTAVITAGLIYDRKPYEDNYGIYFYCNNRLIVKELRTHEVGYFISSEAGTPHPDASLCRVIIRLNGPAQRMPWNSSKTGINYGHDAFQLVRPTLLQLATHFSSLSRRFKNDREEKIYPFKDGAIKETEIDNVSAKNPLILPTLPRVRKDQIETLLEKNKSQIDKKPWTLGLVEVMAAIGIISRAHLETKNRISLILLDSNFEIALKEFIVHRTDLFPSHEYNDKKIQGLFSKRHLVITEVTKKISIPIGLLDKARHYYSVRNKLIHERATVGVTNSDVDNYRKTIEKILKILFDLKFPA